MLPTHIYYLLLVSGEFALLSSQSGSFASKSSRASKCKNLLGKFTKRLWVFGARLSACVFSQRFWPHIPPAGTRSQNLSETRLQIEEVEHCTFCDYCRQIVFYHQGSFCTFTHKAHSQGPDSAAVKEKRLIVLDATLFWCFKRNWTDFCQPPTNSSHVPAALPCGIINISCVCSHGPYRRLNKSGWKCKCQNGTLKLKVSWGDKSFSKGTRLLTQMRQQCGMKGGGNSTASCP